MKKYIDQQPIFKVIQGKCKWKKTEKSWKQ